MGYALGKTLMHKCTDVSVYGVERVNIFMPACDKFGGRTQKYTHRVIS